MIETTYGTVSSDETGTEVSGEFAQLHAWATRPGLAWPCSQLAKLDSISTKFDARGDLVDLTVAFDGLPAGPSPDDLGADELSAWSSDVLRAAGLTDHPAIRGDVESVNNRNENIDRCPVCGGMNPGDITHARC